MELIAKQPCNLEKFSNNDDKTTSEEEEVEAESGDDQTNEMK